MLSLQRWEVETHDAGSSLTANFWFSERLCLKAMRQNRGRHPTLSSGLCIHTCISAHSHGCTIHTHACTKILTFISAHSHACTIHTHMHEPHTLTCMHHTHLHVCTTHSHAGTTHTYMHAPSKHYSPHPIIRGRSKRRKKPQSSILSHRLSFLCVYS